MKDIEKIKSEDLAAQVQDANPGNFAIEQEVAQLVGATVPQPTEPSADDARELGAQLLVFLRRALLPIRSALRTAVTAIYAHLDSRCTDYTPAAYAPFRILPYDPMRPLTPRTLPNLLTAITAFSDRKITGVPEAPDGSSLLQLFYGELNASITELDDTDGLWSVTQRNRQPASIFPNLNVYRFPRDLNVYIEGSGGLVTVCNKDEIHIHGINSLDGNDWNSVNVSLLYNLTSVKRVYVHDLKKAVNISVFGVRYATGQIEEFYADELEEATSLVSRRNNGYWVNDLPNIRIISARGLKKAKGNSIGDSFHGGLITAQCPLVEELPFVSLEEIDKCYLFGDGCVPNLKRLVTKLIRLTNGGVIQSGSGGNRPNFIHFEIGNGMESNLSIPWWNPTNALDASRTDLIEQGSTAENNLDQFLQNFKNYIALRLTSNGSGKTLTLHRDVVDAIDAAEATYGIRHIICNQKGWTISPAPTA